MMSIFAVLLLGISVGFVVSEEGQYMRTNYPNPQADYNACGRDRKSWLCDPSGILQVDQAFQIDTKLEKFYNQTQCPCSDFICKNQPGGYRLAVALVKRMGASDRDKQNEDKNADSVYTNLHRGRLFAYTLKFAWAMDKCEDGILIFYSEEDNVLYTMVGTVAQRKLRGNIIGEIAMKHRMSFGPGRDIATGLRGVIDDYRSVLFNVYDGMAHQESKPRYAAVVSKGSPNSGSRQSIPGILILLFVFVLHRY